MSETAAEPKVSEDLSREIDEGVEEAMAEAKAGQDDASAEGSDDKDKKTVDNVDGKNIPLEEDRSGDDDEEGNPSDGGKKKVDGADGEDKDAVTDESIERAVQSKCFSMAEAKAFPNETLLKDMCDKLDAQNKKDGGDTESGEGASDPLVAIPDLDPEEYDEKIINGFQALKGIVQKQSEEIKALRADGEKSAVQGFFDSKVSKLSEEFAKALKDDPKKHAALCKQHEVLAAGYEATGEKVSPDAVFDQAVAAIMGDVKNTIKEKKLGSREKQQISRPSGAKTEASADPMEEIADVLDKKYFGKK